MMAGAAEGGDVDDTVQSDLLIAPHHGSATSSSKAFLQAVSPRQIVIQAGRRNRYGHPAAEVTARYEEMGLAWSATTTCGMHVWSSEALANSPAPRHSAMALGWCWREAHTRYWQAP